MTKILPIILLLAVLLAGLAMQKGETVKTQAVASEIRDAAVNFLESLSPELRKQVTFTLDHPERRKWSNLPVTIFKREGVSFKEMSSGQRKMAHRLLRSTLSAKGYLKTTGIMHLDEILKGMAAERRPNRTPMFGHDLYWIGIFGDPSKDTTWGWQLDGHHLALNITVASGLVSVTPTFMGSDPAEIPDGTYSGWYVQEAEDEKGKQFFASLSDAQRKKAIIDAVAPPDVITGPTHGDQLKTTVGLPASELDAKQRRHLVALIAEYVYNYQRGIAKIQMEKIFEAGLDKVYFAWAGTEKDKPYYYRIHGPAVIIEFDNHFPPGRNAGPINHIHTVFREPGNDYGATILARHLKESHKK